MSPRALVLLHALLFASLACRSAAPRVEGSVTAIDWQVDFEGARAFDRDDLFDAVKRDLSGPGESQRNKARADDAAFSLELFYRAEGFPDALVDYEYEETDAPRVRFLIEEGARVRLGRVVLSGNNSIEESVLRSFVEKDSSFMGLGAGEVWFVRRQLEAARSSILRFYYQSGFLNAEVVLTELGRDTPPSDEPDSPEPDTPASIDVEFAVDEGVRHLLQDILALGAPDETAARIAAIAAEYRGTPYTPHLGFELRARVVDLCGQYGYPQTTLTEIEDKIDPSTGAVQLGFRVVPGELTTITAIRFTGLETLRERRVRARLPVQVGDRYDSRKIRETFRDLYATGLFNSVEIALDPLDGSVEQSGQGAPDATEDPLPGLQLGGGRTLRIDVEEAPSLEFYVEPGYGSYEGPRLRLGALEKSLFGSGRTLRSELAASPRAQRASLSFIEPWLFDSDFSGEAALFANRREEPAFTVRELGAGLFVRRRWNPTWSTTLGYEYRITDLSDIDDEASLPVELTENVDVASVSLSATGDSSDRLFTPGSGSRVTTKVSLANRALGSEVEFVSGSLSLAHYLTLGRETVLAGQLRTGVIVPVGETDAIPLQLRLFNGGENSVRAFREDELEGPDPLGGEASTTLSLELRQPLAGNLSGAVFADYGNVELAYEDYWALSDMRLGLGVGLRYLLPIGPLRLDLGFNPDRESGEDAFVLHFSVGMPF